MQFSCTAYEHHIIVGEIAGSLYQIAVTLVVHQPSQREHHMPPAILTAQSLHSLRVRLDADGQSHHLVLPALETGRLGQIDRRSAHDDIGTMQEPLLQGTVELEQDTLLGYIAMPVKHHTSAVARQVECETSHGIGDRRHNL